MRWLRANPYASAVLLGAMLAGAIARLHAAFTDDGIFWPDEIYQSLEPAHRVVFGYGMVAWEFVEGARNWALPGLVAGVLFTAKAFGLTAPEQYLGFIRVFFIAVSLATVWSTFRLARTLGANPLAAATGAATFACAALPLYFAHRAMSENACVLPVTLGFAFLLEKRDARESRHVIIGASLLGLAVLLRLQCAVFAAGALAILLARREYRHTGIAFGTLLVWAFLFGALDHFTWADAPGAVWGGWFHSARKYIIFNLIEGKAAGWGTAPWPYYFQHLFASQPALSVMLLLGALLGARKAPGLFIIVAVFFALHSATAHKEIRFVLPLLPLAGALLAVALSQLPEKYVAQGLVPLTLFFCLVSTWNAKTLTMGDVGQYPERPQSSAWDDFGPINRLLLAGSKQKDLCGIRVDVTHMAWVGGLTYLHHNVPLYHQGRPDHRLGHFNYLVTFPGSGLPAVAKEGNLELVRLPIDQCVPDPTYAWRLP